MTQWTQLPSYVHSIVDRTPGSILLQTSRFDQSNRHSYLFSNPIEVLSVARLSDIPSLFQKIEEALAGGLHVAGFLSYECGYHFERFDEVDLSTQELPLAWFGIYESPLIFDHAEAGFVTAGHPPVQSHPEEETPTPFTDHATLTIAEDEYRTKILKIKHYIEDGETYQVNFTDSVSVHTSKSPASAFAALSQSQPVSYSAFLNLADRHILSLSPELFFRIESGRIITRPMKGTMPRGMDSIEDLQQAVKLQNDTKNRSEHLMIVDLLRNDIGRICTMGDIRVEDIFSVERYETLLQMTSTISGNLRPGISFYDIFKSMFPSGSITGAPKIRTMQIIRELERKPRGIYTGAIGFISPDHSSTFNVAIRTLVMKNGTAHMGVGGGIVADSDPAEEYRECLLKTGFLTRRNQAFQLIETMLWQDDEMSFLHLHLERLEASASFFNFPFDRAAILASIAKVTQRLQSSDRYRIRLLLDASGNTTLTETNLSSDPAAASARLSPKTTNSKDVFLRHKTTHREIYEQQLAQARAEGFDEAIFTNERGEITEGAVSNIFIRRADRLLTPPLASGVLPGVYRRHLLDTDPTAQEQVITIEDLLSAEAVFLCNAVRGMRQLKSLFRDSTTPIAIAEQQAPKTR